MKIYFAYRVHVDHTRIGYDSVDVNTYIGECPSYERTLAEEIKDVEISDSYTEEEADFIRCTARDHLYSERLWDVDGAVKYAIGQLEEKKANG